jgi:site-specific DNA-methyltransferase (adenine-specific)
MSKPSAAVTASGWKHHMAYDNDEGFEFDDDMLEHEYQAWQIEIINELCRVLKPKGSLWYNHKCRHLNARDHLPYEFIQKSKANLFQHLIWQRGTVNQSPAFFAPITEDIFWLTNQQVQPKFFKHAVPAEFRNSIWRFGTNRDTDHPAAYPSQLPRNCILATTEEGDIVLDPFCGSGTTCLEAAKLGRRFLGLDISSKYKAMFLDRLRKSIAQGEISPEMQATMQPLLKGKQ